MKRQTLAMWAILLLLLFVVGIPMSWFFILVWIEIP